jgi:Ser/Thr protein kinase RdoA (MazF antagonist)
MKADGQSASCREVGARFRRIAERVLAHYSLPEAQYQYLGHSGGVAFRVETLKGGQAYLLKLHTHLRGDSAVLESGLLWLAALAEETDLVVQEPVRTAEGRLVVEVTVPDEPGKTVCGSLVRWVDGDHFPGAPSWRESRFVPCSPQWACRLGVMVAKLHRHASQWIPPLGYTRPRYDAARMYEWLRELRSLVQEGRIAPEEVELLAQAAQRVERLMVELGTDKPYWGLVHADLCPDNYVICGDEVRPLDFDLCGFSYYMLDVAYALLWHSPRNRCAFLEGYGQLRTLPYEHQRLIEAFIVWGVITMLKFWSPAPALIARTCARYVRGEPFLFG